MSFTPYLASQMLNKEFGGTDWSVPSTLYFGLLRSLPDPNSTATTGLFGATEASGSNYARAALTNQRGKWVRAAESALALASSLKFQQLNGSPGGSIRGVGIFDGATVGGNNLLMAEALDSVVTFASGDTPVIPANTIFRMLGLLTTS